MKAIDSREALLKDINKESERLQRVYIESHDITIDSSYLQRNLGNLFVKMRSMRAATVELSDALGAWARIVHKEKKEGMQRKVNYFDNENDPRKFRKYCVIIAMKSQGELYPMSMGVESAQKKYCRGVEPPKSGVDNKLIGVYDNVAEAHKAFAHAFSEIPQEYVYTCMMLYTLYTPYIHPKYALCSIHALMLSVLPCPSPSLIPHIIKITCTLPFTLHPLPSNPLPSTLYPLPSNP